jgi:hypothetical protein
MSQSGCATCQPLIYPFLFLFQNMIYTWKIHMTLEKYETKVQIFLKMSSMS